MILYKDFISDTRVQRETNFFITTRILKQFRFTKCQPLVSLYAICEPTWISKTSSHGPKVSWAEMSGVLMTVRTRFTKISQCTFDIGMF